MKKYKFVWHALFGNELNLDDSLNQQLKLQLTHDYIIETQSLSHFCLFSNKNSHAGDQCQTVQYNVNCQVQQQRLYTLHSLGAKSYAVFKHI